MLHSSSATESTACFAIPRVQRSCDAIYSRSRLEHLSGLWCQHAFPSHTNCFTLLRSSEAVTQHSSLAVSLGLPVSHCCVGADEAWLQKCYTGCSRYPVVPARSSPGGHECSGSTRLPVQSTRPHHSAALPSALFSCAGANSVQTRRAVVPVCPWTGAGLPGGRSTAYRWTSWSTTPAFIIDLGTGCTTDTAFHDRRPSVPRHCGKNLEQSAIRSDVFSVCKHLRLNSRLVCFSPLSHSWL